MKVVMYIALILSVSLIVLGVVPWIFFSECPFVIRLILSSLAIVPGVGYTVISIEEIKED